ncbi:MAG: Xaa-Pro peptidase family protein [Planctomycetaceae bacterium]|nr:Xaa-Pro peptidase family protein [Planctomycetaceae bacterium]
MSHSAQQTPRMMAGIPTLNAGLYRSIRFLVGDPVVYLQVPQADGRLRSTLICRDIEMGRAKLNAAVDDVACPADFAPSEGLSGDRETATAQSAAEMLRRSGFKSVVVDRSLPMIYAEMLKRAGIGIECDTQWGVMERRRKDAREIEMIRDAQRITEEVMELACSTIAKATVDSQGILVHDGAQLTSERMRTMIDVWLLERDCSNPGAIVACGPIGADCHDHGHGPLYTAQPVIVDIFPRVKSNLYNGDCTRTVVHGTISSELTRMHQAVVSAKHAATKAVGAGVTGEQVHQATVRAIEGAGYRMGLPSADAPDSYTSMTHGTGHGLGLEVHEPPLLAVGGPELVVGDVVTIEPGLYCKAIGGIRVEDMVVVTEKGCENLNRLHEGLCWK